MMCHHLSTGWAAGVVGLALAMLIHPVQSATRDSATAESQSIRSSAWQQLFDGKSLDAWRGYKSDAVPSGWRVVDGTLTKEARTGDIVSKGEFADFELQLDWKIGEAGNSGIFYRGTEEYDHIYWSAPEYQL